MSGVISTMLRRVRTRPERDDSSTADLIAHRMRKKKKIIKSPVGIDPKWPRI